MNRQQLIDLASNSIKNYSTNIYPSLVDWLDEGQIDIVRRTECFTDTKSILSVDGTREYALGVDVMKILNITYDSKELQPTSLERLSERVRRYARALLHQNDDESDCRVHADP
jgi:hypothetical protein